MRLEVGTFPVSEIVEGSQTHWNDGVLEIDLGELRSIVSEDPNVGNFEIDIVQPGDDVRVINYMDIVEPKVKLDGPGIAYPGICGRSTAMVGQGRTHRLGGCAVVECIDTSQVIVDDRVGFTRKQSGSPDPFFDMSGRNAVTPWALMHNICVSFEAPSGMNAEDRHRILHSATLRISDRLAQTVADLAPPEQEVFDLTPKEGLPGAVFIPHLSSTEWSVGARSSLGMAVYGQTRLSAPWLIEGTEMLDGAVSQRHSWMLANNPVVLDMCRRHGKTFNFLGCIIQRTNWTMQVEKEMAAERAAHLAAKIGAGAAITTTDIRGQRFVETILTLQACERMGIKTVLLTEEEDPEGGTAPPLLVSPPEVVSVVSLGTGSVPDTFASVGRVVGALSHPDEHWFGEQPPIPGRYGAYHAQDIFGWGTQSLADY